MKILVVDDTDAVLLLITRFVQALGHEVIQAHNGDEAVTLWRKERPDLLLMDVVMPVMTGPEAAEVIKQEAGESWVPIIFVTSVGEETILAEALERCADDYLAKPVNFRVLEAKLKAFSRTLDLTRKVREQSAKLSDYFDHSEEEKRVVRHLMDQMVNAERLADASLKYWLSPAESLSGDLIASARTPGRVLHVMLADGIGHGITAALNVLPLTQPFYSMTEKGYGISDILQEMNSKVRQVLPVGRFVAVAVIAIDEASRRIEIWNSGMPAVQVLNLQGAVVHSSKSTNLPLGILPNSKMDFSPDCYYFNAPGVVFAHSDGLTEARREDGEAFGLERVLGSVHSVPSAQWLSAMQGELQLFLAGAAHHDDVSLILADFALEPVVLEHRPAVLPLDRVLQEAETPVWNYVLRLGAKELKSFKPVPFLMTFLNGVAELRAVRSDVFRILSELCVEVTDRYLLGLSPVNDESETWQKEYRAERERRFGLLQDGWLEIRLSWLICEGIPQLLLQVAWSGSEASAIDIHLPLMHALCSEVRHNPERREIIASYVPEL